MNPILQVRPEMDQEGVQVNTGYWVQCPGCDTAHRLAARLGDGPGWEWNGSLDAPTFTPSLLVNRGQAHPGMPVCHSFIVDGTWTYLSDSTHALAGQTVPLPPLPDWMVSE